MLDAGAVRAMELDIIPYWPSFTTYHYPGLSIRPTSAGHVRSPYRYLTTTATPSPSFFASRAIRRSCQRPGGRQEPPRAERYSH